MLDRGSTGDDQNNKIEQHRRRAAMFEQCAKEAKNSEARRSFEQLAREWRRELTAEQGAQRSRADSTGPELRPPVGGPQRKGPRPG
jgi:hypothetical protein